jgi:hypothetical protein
MSKKIWASSHIFWNLRGYCLNLKENNTLFGVICKHHDLNYLVQAIRGVMFMPKNIQFTCTTLFRISHKTFGLHNIYLEFGGYCIALAKPRRKTIPTSFCDNIINHEIKFFFWRYLFQHHYIMPKILIQVYEGSAKFFTLMLEGSSKQNYGI